MKRLAAYLLLLLLLFAPLAASAAEPAAPPITPLAKFLVPGTNGQAIYATFALQDGKAVLLIGPSLDAWSLTPYGPAPTPTPPAPVPPSPPTPPVPPAPTPAGVEKVATDAANALPADPKRAGEAAVQATIYEALAAAITKGDIKNPEQLRLQISMQRTAVLDAGRLAYWDPWTKAWGAWVNGEMAAGRLKEIAGFAAVCTATAAGLRKVVQ